MSDTAAWIIAGAILAGSFLIATYLADIRMRISKLTEVVGKSRKPDWDER